MCGIVGQMNWDGQRPVLTSSLRGMAEQVQHRGPDDRGLYIDGNLGLGHQRLSIIDLSPAGHQPMSSESGRYWITYNGEIYNYRELRRGLETAGCRFRSQTDTEVLLALYERHGMECLLELQGMFAFAIWDKLERVLFLARDPLGIKPLYYYQDNERFLFASEIKAILACPDVPREIDPQGLQTYFAHGHSTAPVTMYRGVRKLQPGHWISVRNGQVNVRQYWNPQPGLDRDDHHLDWEEKASEMKELLAQSVEAHLVSDRPVGVFLSGGLDSSAIVALMARSGKSKIRTFSIGFDFGRRYNELDDARIVARHFGTEHHELILHENDLFDSLHTLVYHYDEPFGDPAAFPTYFVSQLARGTVTVALSGEGADELFGGYRRYLAERYSQHYRALPRVLRDTIIPGLVRQLPRSSLLKKLPRIMNISDPVERQGNWQIVFHDELRHSLFTSQSQTACNGKDVYESFRRHRQPAGSDGLNGVMFADVRSWLSDCYLEKVDKASMAVSLEARVPFLDRSLVEFALQLPAEMKVQLDWGFKGRSLKRLFRRVLQDLLPKSILEKPKHGFAVPIDPWFRNGANARVKEILLDDRTRRRGYFNMDLVEKLLNEHKQGKEARDWHLWLLLNFELWHRIYLDCQPTRPESIPVRAAAPLGVS